MKHYKYGGSTAARTMACPAWISLSADMPKQLSSSFADVGTMLHDCMEHILLDDKTPQDFLGYKHEAETVTQDMVDNKLTPALEAFQQLCKEYNLTDYEAETTMEYDDLIGGTADFIAAGEDVVVVGDWKFGEGIAVSPENSAQGLFYAMLARKKIPDMFEGRDRIVIAIIQPSSRGEDTLKVWETDTFAVAAFEHDFFNAVMYSENEGGGEPNPGDHCKWCPAAPTCPAKTGLILKAQRLNPAQKDTVSEALEVAAELDVWIKDVRKFAHEQMELGVKFDGFKLVQKRAYKKWHDEEGALTFIRNAKKLTLDECQTHTILSPAKLTAVCKKKGFDFDKLSTYCSATSSGTTIATAADKRPEYIAGGAMKALRDRLG